MLMLMHTVLLVLLYWCCYTGTVVLLSGMGLGSNGDGHGHGAGACTDAGSATASRQWGEYYCCMITVLL